MDDKPNSHVPQVSGLSGAASGSLSISGDRGIKSSSYPSGYARALQEAAAEGSEIASSEDGNGSISASNSAETNYANLIRGQYEDYVKYALPNYELLLGAATSPTFVSDAVARTRNGIESGFSVARDQQERDINAFRISESGRQKRSRDSSFALNKAAVGATAENQTRIQSQDVQNNILVGGLGSVLNNAGAGNA